MPKFSFDCKCGTRFSRTLKMGEHQTYPCPACGNDAPRLWEGFGFNFAAGGTAPGNSGVTKHDYPTDDFVVGRDAEARWQDHFAREEVKNKVRAGGGSRTLIRKNGKDYVEYVAANEKKLVEDRKKVSAELTEVLNRPKVTQ